MNQIKINNRRYMWSKFKVLFFIKEIIEKENIKFTSFCDIFWWTWIVADFFNNEDTKIIINDLLYSNYISYIARFWNGAYKKSKIKKIIEFYNTLEDIKDNYFSINFGDTYFSHFNCKKIGFIRENIEQRYLKWDINWRERAILITSLLYAMDKIANTVWHYDAYRMNGNLDKELILKELDLKPNIINKNNKIFNENANDLVRKIKCDVIYIDPPYNSRQYFGAYHLLENIAMWQKEPVFWIAKKIKDESKKSDYCSIKATKTFSNLINNIEAKYIIVSHNNMEKKWAWRSQAKISDQEILDILSTRGEVKLYDMPFKQFSTWKTNIDNHKEELFICKINNAK